MFLGEGAGRSTHVFDFLASLVFFAAFDTGKHGVFEGCNAPPTRRFEVMCVFLGENACFYHRGTEDTERAGVATVRAVSLERR